MSEFDLIAPFYDLEYGDLLEDIPFYINFAHSTGSPILELGVGTGRLLLPLAREGFTVTGIDRSSIMLSLARRKLDEELKVRVQLIEADMREFHLDQRFRLAILALDTFMHLVKTEDQLRALVCIASHLVDGGILLLDLSNPLWAGLDRGGGELVLDWMKHDAATGRRVAKLVSCKVEHTTQTQHLVLFYDATDERGSLQRSVVTLRMHYFHRPEVEQLLERSGFRVEQVYGSYDLEDYTAESPRMIFVARREP